MIGYRVSELNALCFGWRQCLGSATMHRIIARNPFRRYARATRTFERITESVAGHGLTRMLVENPVLILYIERLANCEGNWMLVTVGHMVVHSGGTRDGCDSAAG